MSFSDEDEIEEVEQQLSTSRSYSPLYDPRPRLSRITEHTEESSRPPSRVYHGRAATDSSLPPPGRTNALIAQFESSTASSGYSSSRPSSPTKSDTRQTMSSLFSPRTPTTTTATATNTFSPRTYTDTFTPSTYTNTLSHTYSPSTFTNTMSTATPTTHTPLRRPSTSPRSPLASVRNIVALWKERSPSTATWTESKSPSASSVSPPTSEGLFGIRRRAQRVGALLRDHQQLRADPSVPLDQSLAAETASVRTTTSGRSAGLSASFDISEFSPFTQSNEPPLHIGLLWYLNVHADPPYRWQRCQALLYPHILLLSWLAPGGGRGIVGLDLLNCTDVQSAPSPNHPLSRDDVGTVAARQQSSERDGQPLMDMLVPFHMLYGDGVERLAAESLLERQKWVNRLWEAVNRPVQLPDSVSVTRSPTGSIRTIQSYQSQSSAASTESRSNGSNSTVFVPPLSSLQDISDETSSTSSGYGLRSLAGLTRQSSIVSSHHRGTVDDTVISDEGYVYPGDPRVIAPSRGNSLRRSSSMTDLDEEFFSAPSRSSLLVPPPSSSSSSSGRSSGYTTAPLSIEKKSSSSRTSDSDDNFFSAESSQRGSTTSYTQTSLTSPPTRTGGLTGLFSGFPLFGIGSLTSGTGIVPSTISNRRTDSASMLGDSHEGSSGSSGSYTGSPYTGSPYTYSSYSPYTSPTPSSRVLLSRAGGVRRRTARTSSRTYSSGYPSGSDDSSDKENSSQDDEMSEPSSTNGGNDSGSGSGAPSGSGTGSGPGSGSGSGPYSTDQTGYDICYSSDLTSFGRRSETPTSSTYTPPTPASSVGSGSQYATASQATTFRTASSTSPSVLSFKSLPSIPSESRYTTVDEGDTRFDTASEREAVTEYTTCPTIPSEPGTPRPPSTVDLQEDRSATPVPPSTVYSVSPPTISTSPPSTPIAPEDSISQPSPSDVSSIDITPTRPSSGVPSTSLVPTEPSIRPSPSVSTPFISTVSTVSSLPESSEEESTLLSDDLSSPSSLPPSSPTPTVPSLEVPSSPTPTHLAPSSDHEWDASSTRSYDSSILLPSPSVRSITLQEGPDISFETSILRPTGSVPTETDRISIPQTPVSSEYMSSPSRSSLPPVSPRVVSTPSESLTVPTISSSTISYLSRSSSVSSTLSYMSQSSITSSVLGPRSLWEEEIGEEPSTEPSLVSTIRAPSSPPSTVTARPTTPRSLETPNPSMRASISTPTGHIPSVHTIESETMYESITPSPSPSPPPTESTTEEEEDLVGEIRRYDNNRALENDNMLGRLDDIQQVLQDLVDRPHQIVYRDGRPIMVPVPPEDRDKLIKVISDMSPPPESPATSSYESVGSFLSSHHSDDDLSVPTDYSPRSLGETVPSIPSSPFSSPPPPSSPSSSSSTISPLGSSSSTTSTSTIRPQVPPNYMSLLTAIQERVSALWEGQRSTNHMLDQLTARPELSGRLQRIEQMLQTLLGRERGAAPPLFDRPDSESVASSEETDMYHLLNWDQPQIVTPQPRTSRRPLAEVLEDILAQPPNLRPSGSPDIPPDVPRINYPLADERRPRSSSPSDVSFQPPPRRSDTAPPFYPADIPAPRPLHPQASPTETQRSPATTEAPLPLPRQPPPQPEPTPVPPRTRPPVGPVMPDQQPRPGTAPANLGHVPYPQTQPWYRPRQPQQARQPAGYQINIPGQPARPGAQIPGQRPPAPPAELDSLMEVLRENRLAQLATVDQQRELMRYMRGLNEWLARDVNDRQNELRSVLARVDGLARAMQGLRQAQGQRLPGAEPRDGDEDSSTETESEDTPGAFYVPGQQFPGYGPQQPGPFIPPNVPGTGAPVIPPGIVFHQPGQPPIGGAPVIPFGPPPPQGPFIPPGQPGTVPFIPPAPHHHTFVHHPASDTSSSSDSRDRSPSGSDTTDSMTPQPMPVVVSAPLGPAPSVPPSEPRLGDAANQAPPAPVVINVPGVPAQPAGGPPMMAPPPPMMGPQLPMMGPGGPVTPIPYAGTIPPGSLPMGSQYGPQYGPPPAPVIVQARSPSRSSRSYSRSPSRPPVIVQTRSRSRSSSRGRRRYRSRSPQQPLQQQPQTVILPQQGSAATPAQAPPQVPIVLPSGRSRSRSYTPPRIVHGYTPPLHPMMGLPGAQPAPVIVSGRDSPRSPAATQAPIVVQAPAAPSAQVPTVLPTTRPRSRTRSRSPRRRLERPRSRAHSHRRSRSPRDIIYTAPSRPRRSRSRTPPVVIAPTAGRDYGRDYGRRPYSPSEHHGHRRPGRRDYSYSPEYYNRRPYGHHRRPSRDRYYSRSPPRHHTRRSGSFSPPLHHRSPSGGHHITRTHTRRSGSFSPPLHRRSPSGGHHTTRTHGSPVYSRRPSVRGRSASPLHRPLSPVAPAHRPSVVRAPSRVPTIHPINSPRSESPSLRQHEIIEHGTPYHPPHTAQPTPSHTPYEVPVEVDSGRYRTERPTTATEPRPAVTPTSRGTATPAGPTGRVSHEAQDVTEHATHPGIPPERHEPQLGFEDQHRPLLDEDQHRPGVEGDRRPFAEEEHRPFTGEPFTGEEQRRPRSATPHSDVTIRPYDDSGRFAMSPLPSEPREAEATPVARPAALTPLPDETRLLDVDHEARENRMEAMESRLQSAALGADQSEDRREAEFRHHEEERERIFLENEKRRSEDAQRQRQALGDLIATRPADELPMPEHPPIFGTTPSLRPLDELHTEATPSLHRTPSHAASVFETDSVRTAMRGAFGRQLDEFRAIVAEELARNRAEDLAEKQRLDEERTAETAAREEKIRSLEDELAAVRAELEAERQQHITEANEARDQFRADLVERDDGLRTQLTDITNLVQQNRDCCERNEARQLQDEADRTERRTAKEAQILELRDLVQQMNRDMQDDRARAEELQLANEGKPGTDAIIEELRKQNAEQQGLLNALSESWRADLARHHDNTLDAVRATAGEQVPFNVQGYLDEFSKALASEVRILLGEVGKLREERRALQHELGYLLCMKSKYGPGGEFEPDWKPPTAPGPPPPPEPPAPPPELPNVRPGWRPVHQRSLAKKKKKESAAAAAPFIPPPGPDPRAQVQSWATWHPNPDMAPTPPSVEPTLLVPDRGSPGLFGPRSPRDSRSG